MDFNRGFFNSNSHQNPMDDSVFVTSPYQNDTFMVGPRSFQPSSACLNGQLGLGQVVTEVRRTYVTPHGVHIDRFIDYSPNQNQLVFPPGEVVGISEVTRTSRFLTPTPTSTMEPLMAPNTDLHDVFMQGQLTKFRNQTISPTNFLHETDPFINLDHQKHRPVLNLRTPWIIQRGKYGEVFDSERLSALTPTINDQNPRQIPNPNPNGGGQVSDTGSRSVEYDGRTHSLSYKKYGPYTCPRCRGVFRTSQSFAAHMLSHYKYETSAERKTRLAARCKKRNPRVVHSSDEMLADEDQSSNEQRHGTGRGQAIISAEVEDAVEKHSTNGDVVEVKEEIVDEDFEGEAETETESE